MNVSVVIPAYNEGEVISSILNQLIQIDALQEIIVVNDGSTDNTAEVVSQFAKVTLISHPYNLGNGAAVKTGIRAATGEYILIMDGDGQHPPADIPRLLEHVDKYDMVVGARTSESESAWHRNIANAVFNAYASYIVSYRVEDLTSGFRVVRARIARSFLYLLPNKFSYPSTLTIALFRAGYAVKYVPFAAPARVGSSKIRPVRDGLRFLLTVTRLATLFVPLKIFIPVSLLFLLIGSSYTAATLVLESRFSGMGGMIIMIGAFVFLLGLISEQIALLRYINSEQ
ncbi:MAG: glycosyltransferase family 2 protein [Anaerolineae bacterium]|nr:glycosyltransferase family 2 protein [Anaerolineae bacterium]